AMLAYPWPGNVRELDNVMQRALILQMGKQIYAEDLGLEGTTVYSKKPDLIQAAQSAQGIQTQTYDAGNSLVDDQFFAGRNSASGTSQLAAIDHQNIMRERDPSELRVAIFDAERIMIANPNYVSNPQLGTDLKQR